MRDTFIDALGKLAEQDDRVMLVTGDLGFKVFDEYRSRYPSQFLNVGIAEQAMAGIATGLALEGHVVFLYSIANFTFMRCLEQLRNGPAYHDCNVNVVSVGGGFSYGQLGMSHHATEDLAVMRCMPTSMVACPAEEWEVAATTRLLAGSRGLKYLRLDKSSSHDSRPTDAATLFVGQPRCLRTGSDITLVGCGGIVAELVLAAAELARGGISAEVISTPFLKPFDVAMIQRSVGRTGVLITVEEHSVRGGLGGLVAEELSELGCMPAVFRRIGLREPFATVVGDQQYLRAKYRLSAQAIVDIVGDALEVSPWSRAA